MARCEARGSHRRSKLEAPPARGGIVGAQSARSTGSRKAASRCLKARREQPYLRVDVHSFAHGPRVDEVGSAPGRALVPLPAPSSRWAREPLVGPVERYTGAAAPPNSPVAHMPTPATAPQLTC